MTAVLVLLAGLFGFLGGLWLMRLTRSDTWAVVQDLHRRVSDLELLVDPDESNTCSWPHAAYNNSPSSHEPPQG